MFKTLSFCLNDNKVQLNLFSILFLDTGEDIGTHSSALVEENNSTAQVSALNVLWYVHFMGLVKYIELLVNPFQDLLQFYWYMNETNFMKHH